MSQWNNSYAYNQYQSSNTWNSETDNQYSNQQYCPNAQPTYEPTNQYVNFQEFLSQMQGSSASASSSASYNPQYQNYPNNHYEYQNMPSTSRNQVQNSYYPTNSSNVNSTEFQTMSTPNTAPEPSCNNPMVFKSNLTPTATEFVPKGISQKQPSPPEDSSSYNELSEAKSDHTADRNWREKQLSQPNSSHSYNEPRNDPESKKKPDKDRKRGNKGRNNNVSSQYETNSQYNELNSQNGDGGEYESNTYSYDSSKHSAEYSSRNHEASSRKYENKNSRRNESTRNNEGSSRNNDRNNEGSSRNNDRNNEGRSRNNDRNNEPSSRNNDRNNEPSSRNNDRNNEPSSRNNDRNNEGSSRNNDSNSSNNELNSRNNDSERNYDSQDRNYSNRNNESDNRQYESSSRNYDSKKRNYNNRNYDSNNRHDGSRNNDSTSRNYDSRNDSGRSSDYRRNDFNGRDSDYSSRNNDNNSHNNDYNSRSNDYNSRNDYNDSRNDYSGRNQDYRESNRYESNRGSKSKSKDADNRTFYNSAAKSSQDVRSARAERGEGSGRSRNWAGTQRVRPMERADDEQFAKGYLDNREDRYSKVRPESMFSPMRNRNKQADYAGNTDMTQRERLSEQLDKGTLECLVCCERVKQIDSVWSCGNCYHVLHLRCIRKWAMSSIIEGKWRCPACQNTSSDIPTEYRCMCGAVRSPDYQRGQHGAHTCGQACQRSRPCPHPCTLPCHPGPCPPCQATVSKQCGCGAETRSILCSSKLPQLCGRVCSRKLECGVHTCERECHEAACGACEASVEQVCYCPAATARLVPCTLATGSSPHWSCGAACARVLSCGAHVCRAPCHAPPCAACALQPASVLACPCGRTRIPKDVRKSCTDPIPLCGNICAKPLQCGPAGDKHFCKLDCHEGPCPVCPDKTLVACRCGHSSREIPCAELPQMLDNVLCQKKCNKKLSCGRHRCRASCCAATTHRCGVVCGRLLACQLHRCEQFCHTGHCAPCDRASFEELTCECGVMVLLPPVPCGSKRPACSAPCQRPRACGHPALHACHEGPCPPCVVLTAKRCHGQHEERKTIPCSQEEFSCGLSCGKPLPCGKHSCQKICHKGPCDAGKCTQPCNEKRPSCGHPCAAPCHSGGGDKGDKGDKSLCPSSAPCRKLVRAQCPCGRRTAERSCHENARELAKIMSALAASKMQEGGSVDLSEVQRPTAMLKTLECDDECRVEARTRRIALALQIRNPDVSAKLQPRYSDHVRALAAREPVFARQVHDKLTELVQLAKKSKQRTRAHSFPSCNWQKRQFIHEMCEQFGCESVAYDAEPNRNVVATADKEKSWLPAMSVLEVQARETGKRRVPGPVLRAPAPAPAASSAANTKSASGWATLTSSNAWAARAQKAEQQQQAQPKIDYFDNPPDN